MKLNADEILILGGSTQENTFTLLNDAIVFCMRTSTCSRIAEAEDSYSAHGNQTVLLRENKAIMFVKNSERMPCVIEYNHGARSVMLR